VQEEDSLPSERSGSGVEGAVQRRSAQAKRGRLGCLLRALGTESLSVLSTCVTKQTKHMRYMEVEPRWFLGLVGRTMMRYALERESYCGSTPAVLVELPEGGDVSL
jgi:hypothetical protein